MEVGRVEVAVVGVVVLLEGRKELGIFRFGGREKRRGMRGRVRQGGSALLLLLFVR